MGLPNKTYLLKVNNDSNTTITEIEKTAPNVTGLVSIVALNTKVTEIEKKMLNMTNLATKTALNTKATEIENKIFDTSYFINTQEFNRLTKICFDARIEEAEKNLLVKLK